MAILFVGGENGDFHGCSMATTTTNTYFNSARARCALYGYSGERATVNLPSSQTDVWVHHRRYSEGYNSGSPDDFVIQEFSDATGLRYRVSYRGSTTTWRLEYLSGGTWTTYASVVTPLVTSGTVVITTRLTIHASTGFFGLYLDGLLVASYTGNTTISGAVSGLTQVAIVTHNYANAYEQFISEVIVANEDIRGLQVVRLSPSAAGATSAWTGTYAEIDETTRDDTDNISSATANQESQFALTDMPSATGTVRGAYVTVRAAKGSSGPQGIQIGVRLSSTNYLSSTLTPSGAYMPLQYELATNPATSAAWTSSDLNSAQLAVKSIT